MMTASTSRLYWWRWLSMCLVLAVAFETPAVTSTILQVCSTSNCSYTQVSSAINASSSGDTIYVYPGYYIDSMWNVTHDLQIVCVNSSCAFDIVSDNDNPNDLTWLVVNNYAVLTTFGQFLVSLSQTQTTFASQTYAFVGVNLTDGATFNQYSMIYLSINLILSSNIVLVNSILDEIYLYGVVFDGDNATWNQKNETMIAIASYTSVYNEVSNSVVGAFVSVFEYGVLLGGNNAVWNQNGKSSISISTNASEMISAYQSSTSIEFTVSSYGALLEGNNTVWAQNGQSVIAIITNASINANNSSTINYNAVSSFGTVLSGYGAIWIQNGSNAIAITTSENMESFNYTPSTPLAKRALRIDATSTPPPNSVFSYGTILSGDNASWIQNGVNALKITAQATTQNSLCASACLLNDVSIYGTYLNGNAITLDQNNYASITLLSNVAIINPLNDNETNTLTSYGVSFNSDVAGGAVWVQKYNTTFTSQATVDNTTSSSSESDVYFEKYGTWVRDASIPISSITVGQSNTAKTLNSSTINTLPTATPTPSGSSGPDVGLIVGLTVGLGGAAILVTIIGVTLVGIYLFKQKLYPFNSK